VANHVAVLRLHCGSARLGYRLDQLALQYRQLCVRLRSRLILIVHDDRFNHAQLVSADLRVNVLVCVPELAPMKPHALHLTLLHDGMNFFESFLISEHVFVFTKSWRLNTLDRSERIVVLEQP